MKTPSIFDADFPHVETTRGMRKHAAISAIDGDPSMDDVLKMMAFQMQQMRLMTGTAEVADRLRLVLASFAQDLNMEILQLSEAIKNHVGCSRATQANVYSVINALGELMKMLVEMAELVASLNVANTEKYTSSISEMD